MPRRHARTLKLTLAGAASCAVLLWAPAPALAQSAHVTGFGGLTARSLTAPSETFGGGVAVPLSSNLQVIVEGGRMADLTRPVLADVIALTPGDLRVSALYGEVGVRVLGSDGRAVRPYVEATAGLARLSVGVNGLGSDLDAIVNGALGLAGRTEPMLGIGGGVLLQGGPLVVDLGYRYKRVVVGSSLQSLITGSEIGVSQMRLGIGVRF